MSTLPPGSWEKTRRPWSVIGVMLAAALGRPVGEGEPTGPLDAVHAETSAASRTGAARPTPRSSIVIPPYGAESRPVPWARLLTFCLVLLPAGRESGSWGKPPAEPQAHHTRRGEWSGNLRRSTKSSSLGSFALRSWSAGSARRPRTPPR